MRKSSDLMYDRRPFTCFLVITFLICFIAQSAQFGAALMAKPGEFSGERTWDDGTNVYFRFTCSRPFAHLRIYIDFDDNPNTGYTVNGIGADYMIQDDKVYHSRHSGAQWAWGSGNPIVLRTSPAQNTYEFSVPLQAIGSPQEAKIAFEGADDGGQNVDDPTVIGFTPGTMPYLPQSTGGSTTPSNSSQTQSTGGGDNPTTNDAVPPPPSQIDDSQAGWIWSGMVEIDDDQCKGGTEHAGGPSTYAAYTFTGTGVDVYATTGPSIQTEGRVHKLGRMKIVIDGKLEGQYSLYQSYTTYQSKVFSVNDLTPSVHVLQLESDSGWIDVDYLQVSTVSQPAAQPASPQ